VMGPNGAMAADQQPLVSCVDIEEDIEAGDASAPMAEQPESWLGPRKGRLGLQERRPLSALLATGAISAILAAAALLLAAAHLGHVHDSNKFAKKNAHIAAAAAMVGLEVLVRLIGPHGHQKEVLIRLIGPHGHQKEAHVAPQPREMLNLDGDTANKPDCFTKRRGYSPLDMVGSIPRQANNAEDCQQRCFHTKRCQHFSFDEISNVCHMQDEKASLWKVPSAFTSGPRVCNGKALDTPLVVADAIDQAAPTHEQITDSIVLPEFSTTAAETLVASPKEAPAETTHHKVTTTLATGKDTGIIASQMKLSSSAPTAPTTSSSAGSGSSTTPALTKKPLAAKSLITLTDSSEHTNTEAVVPEVANAVAGLRASMKLRARPGGR